MEKKKYLKIISVPVREEMFLEVQKICEKLDIPLSLFIREAIKMKLEIFEK